MATVQFGGDLDGQAHPLPGGLDPRLVRDGAQEIAAQTDKGLHRLIQHAFAHFHRGPARIARRIEVELRRERV